MMTNLTLQLCSLPDQIAAMTSQDLKLLKRWINGFFKKPESVDSRSEDSTQIIVVGLVVSVFGLSVEAGCKRMHKSGLIPGFAERSHGRLVKSARHFNGDDEVFETMFFHGLLQRQHGQVKGTSVMFNDRGLAEHLSIEVGEHPLGPHLGTVDGNDAKLLRADGLHPCLNDALRPAEDVRSELLRPTPLPDCPDVTVCTIFADCGGVAVCADLAVRNHFCGLRE